ncbi:MAG: agmatine deiminase family protein [Flavobacteriales bacterium]|nr:agmatine deiminase family protein [Flavobacteriales bacterium]
MSRFFLLSFILFSFNQFSSAQTEDVGLPHNLTPEEIEAAEFQVGDVRNITTPPPYTNMRTMAEWEELQALVVSWISYPIINKKIVAAAKLECEVIILTSNIATTQSYLTANNAGGPPMTLDNITFIQSGLNSVWQRDYGPNNVYGNEVDNLFLVDWIYNRPRPLDDLTPDAVGNNLGLSVYNTTVAPNNLMNTGGNFMSDGFGTAFASELVLMENMGGSAGWTNFPNHTEAQIDGIMNDFMGIDNYIKMPVLPFDGIHHIDMHMKLIDEETILLSKYPEGVADGPQIEANINYVLNNFTTKWGTPFKIIEIPAPPQQSNGNYPDEGGWYLTYANSVFVNKTVILPTYYTQYDTTAIRIYQEALPGYNIVPIDCDNSSANIISAGGAIHCITHEIGVNDPLLISYKNLEDTNDNINAYPLTAYINHQSGIANATLYYKTTLGGTYSSIAMSGIGGNEWTASIPTQSFGTTVYYYVQAIANNGKVQVRPIVAPEGYKSFKVIDAIFGCTSPTACNYDPAATINNGTCLMPDGCTDSAACNYDASALCDDGSCQSGAIHHVTILTDCWGEETSWTITNTGGTILYSQSSGTLGDQQTYSWDVCLNTGCYNFNIYDAYGDGVGGSQWASCDVDGDYELTDDLGNVLVNMTVADFGASEIHSFCATVIVSGCTNSTACNYNPSATQDNGSCTFPGCTNPIACNYSSTAGCDDGTCTMPGCTNPLACNYNPASGCDNGSCLLPGCTDVGACNYASSAGCDDGSCDYSCLTSCVGDFDGNGVINTSDLLLFMAEFSCVSSCGSFDLDGNGAVNTSDLLLFMALFGAVCP